MPESGPNVDSPPGRLTRRQWLQRIGGAGLAACVGTGMYARYVEPFRPVIERRRMDLPRLGAEFDGYRIVQISDLHVGPTMPVGYLSSQLARVVEMRPELLVITGDFLTFAYPGQVETVAALTRGLTARDGVIAVLGNHDYNHDRSVVPQPRGHVAAALTAALTANGVRVLRNERMVIERGPARLQMVGLEDWSRGFYDSRRAFAGVDPSLPTIALEHNPDAVFELTQRRRPCHWVLCGHTHGGQVRLPGVGPVILPHVHTELDQGLFEIGGVRLYINRGLGFVYKLRWNCPPEITEFTLAARA